MGLLASTVAELREGKGFLVICRLYAVGSQRLVDVEVFVAPVGQALEPVVDNSTDGSGELPVALVPVGFDELPEELGRFGPFLQFVPPVLFGLQFCPQIVEFPLRPAPGERLDFDFQLLDTVLALFESLLEVLSFVFRPLELRSGRLDFVVDQLPELLFVVGQILQFSLAGIDVLLESVPRAVIVQNLAASLLFVVSVGTQLGQVTLDFLEFTGHIGLRTP